MRYSTPLLLLCGLLAAKAATAEPVFSNAALDLGLDFAADHVRFLPDSKEKDVYYAIPAAFSEARLMSQAFGGVEDLVHITRSVLENGLTRYSLFLGPDLDVVSFFNLFERLGERAQDDENFRVKPLACLEDAEVRLTGVPQHLLRRVRIRPVALEGFIPAGYIYSVDLDTREPEALEAVLLRLGVHGSAVVHCSGYPAGANTELPAVTVEQAIPVNAKFDGFLDK